MSPKRTNKKQNQPRVRVVLARHEKVLNELVRVINQNGDVLRGLIAALQSSGALPVPEPVPNTTTTITQADEAPKAPESAYPQET